jgi:mevalonate pyrophosphate decarboxylase
MQDTHALRQTNVMLNERVQMVIKRATSASDANKVLTSRLSSVERERDAVRALVNAERQRAEDYGTIVETARAQVAKREVELQRLRGDGESSAYSVTGEASTVSGAPSNVTKGSSSSASSAAAAAAVLNQSLGLSDEDSILTPPAQGHLHKD